MKKMIFVLIGTILICLTFNFFHLIGARAVIDLTSIVVGIIYLVLGFTFLRNKERRRFNISLGLLLIIAASFAILPLLIFFLNQITFIVNINYNDILFNIHKGYLNSLIGLAIFMLVCLIHFFTKLQESNTDEDKKTYKRLLLITSLLMISLGIVLTRKFGYHISYSRVVTKVTILVSVLLILPFMFYSGLIKNKLFTISFLVLLLNFLNGVPANYVFSADFSHTRWLVYDNPVREATKSGIDTLKTISSLQKISENFYEITYYGDYTNILEQNNKKCLEESINTGHFCSLFTSFADSANYLFARNFDNPEGWKCKTLLCRTNPKDGYSSLTLTRMADFGFDVSENIEGLSNKKKSALVNAVFWPPDGINERGLVVALAAVDEQMLKGDAKKPFINCTYLVREILDHAKNIEEAIDIIKKYNIMNDMWKGSFDNHLLIADSSGRSIIAEIDKGEFTFTQNTKPWQTVTNSLTYNIELAQQKKICFRLEAIESKMESVKGHISIDATFDLLNKIGHQYTEWSTVYDISQKQMTVAIDHNYAKTYKFSFTKVN
jgi:hypothetical protein